MTVLLNITIGTIGAFIFVISFFILLAATGDEEPIYALFEVINKISKKEGKK